MALLSPAKLNVHLAVGPKTPDGYHNICSWFLKVSLFDEILVDINGVEPGLHVDGNHDIPFEEDLIVKAASLFYRVSGLFARRRISVRKSIPVGAGLGGGSSNAATVLAALNKLHGDILSCEYLERLALQLGSDVPFFLAGPSAVVTGRGEILKEIRTTRVWWALLVHPGFSIHTGEAYGWFDSDDVASAAEDLNAEKLRKLAEGPPEKWRFYNSFSPVLYRKYPILKNICDNLISAGALHASISGSGSSCFGLFETRAKASKASTKFKNHRFWLKETLASAATNVL